MGKWLVFEIGKGDFQQGFPVVVRIGSDGAAGGTRIQGYLPPAPSVQIALEHWRQAFEGWAESPHRSIRAKPVQRLNVSFRDAAKDLADSLNTWLNSTDAKWSRIRDCLLCKLGDNDEIRVIVQTENVLLRRLPWQAWNLFTEKYPQAEIAVSPTEQQSPIVTLPNQKPSKVKILAILGNTLSQSQEINIEADRREQEIDIEADRRELERLTGSLVEFLVQPSLGELRDKLWKEDWHILFFAGHSGSFDDGSGGFLELNRQDRITIDDLKESLTRTIKHGLQLVIFNSCDGLGLAKQLEDLYLPQMIVMRERVPDQLAQEFLRYLFGAFTDEKANKSLHAAVREARARLTESLDSEYPGASWLPVICQQHPDAKPLTWKQLRARTWDKPRKALWLFLPVAAVLIVVGVIYVVTHDDNPTSEQQIATKVVDKAARGKYQESFPHLSQQQSSSPGNQQQELPLNGHAITDKLGRGDAVFPNKSYYKLYVFKGRARQQVTIEMNSQAIDSTLILLDNDGNPIARNDDISPSNVNSRIVATLPNDSIYIVVATSSEGGESGAYSIRGKVSEGSGVRGKE